MPLSEILVLHHSHLDIGYTHSQPVLWELQREYIDLALDFLDETAGWPEHSRPRWTCEVTAPVSLWLETAAEADVARFRALVAEGRIGISALELNTTPLCGAEQLARQLEGARELRARLGAPIRTANQHDVNGVPWPLADLLIDSGVELLTMAINIHLGRAVAPRPGIFRWQAPSGRELLVMNGNHYTMFDQLLYSWEGSTARMAEGLAEYTKVLEERGYPHDFLYLTSTNAPALWDNSPPNMEVARLIRAWNEEGREPRIRFVTPDGLLERIRQVPPEALPLLRGDWTDYWNFGCASTAYETRLNQGSKPALFAAELLSAARGAHDAPGLASVRRRAWRGLNLYDEHTWGYHDTTPGHPHGRAQERLKLHHAYEARELADFLLADALEAAAANPPQWRGQEGVLLVNPSGVARQAYVRVPEHWRGDGRRLRAQQFSYDAMRRQDGALCGPVELPPYGWRQVPLAELRPAAEDERLRVSGWPAAEDGRQRVGGWRYAAGEEPAAAVESPFYRLTFDPHTGRVLGLRDLRQGWDVLDASSPYTLFEFVRERTDDLVDDRVEAYYDRRMEREKIDLDCWKTDWRAVRERAARSLGCRVERDAQGVTLVQELEAPGVSGLVQRITLRADAPLVELDVSFEKLERAAPEGIYFTLPLDLPAGWRCHFDTAGVPVELDAEQLPLACRDWLTVESYASIHAGGRGVTLYCPDAPMVQAGGFNFGRLQDAVPRGERPLLLAWPMNNYWNTNFPRVQPGPQRFRYALEAHGPFDPARAAAQGRAVASGVLAHPVHRLGPAAEGRLVEVEGDAVAVLHVRAASDGRGALVRLVNLGAEPVTARVRLGEHPPQAAWRCGALEDDREPLAVGGDGAVVQLAPRQITTVRLVR